MTETRDPILVQWGRNIESAREAKRITRLEIATHCGVHPLTTRRWERGLREPSRQHKALVADLLAVPVAELFPYDEEEAIA